ncbi:MAG: GNAT family N-acetyltransferase [Treponema sp.]|nr:GNAT family N-acetyltransferase [Treponema sp.]
MENILEINNSKIISNILNRAFLAFAQEYNFTKENAPNHLAYINSDGIEIWLNNGLKMYGYKMDDKIIGCVGYSFYKEQIYLIERLATLPEYRNLGVGKKLMGFIENKIRNMGGKIVEIHVTDKNIVLKKWYREQGYVEKKIEEVNIPGIKKVPFKACVMNKELI